MCLGNPSISKCLVRYPVMTTQFKYGSNVYYTLATACTNPLEMIMNCELQGALSWETVAWRCSIPIVYCTACRWKCCVPSRFCVLCSSTAWYCHGKSLEVFPEGTRLSIYIHLKYSKMQFMYSYTPTRKVLMVYLLILTCCLLPMSSVPFNKDLLIHCQLLEHLSYVMSVKFKWTTLFQLRVRSQLCF